MYDESLLRPGARHSTAAPPHLQLVPAEPSPEAPALRTVRCFWCDRLHPGRHSVSVCPACRDRFSTIRMLGMRGSYALGSEIVDQVVTRKAPGNFALGYMEGDSFSVFFVGRSDSDVRERLRQWVGMPSASERYASNAKAPWDTRRGVWAAVDVPRSGCVSNAESGYTHFAFSYADSSDAAFEKELRNFRDFGRYGALDNPHEPAAPTL